MKMKKLLVIGIASVLLISGMLVGAAATHDLSLSNQPSKQSYEPKVLPFNFLYRLLERFPGFLYLLSLRGIYPMNVLSLRGIYPMNADGCLVNLPDYSVIMKAWERPAGWPAFFKIILSEVGSGYDVSDGTYEGWCIDYGTPIPNGIELSVTLYSSYCPPDHLDVAGWNEINYILNHKQGDRWDIQIAIWEFINLGPFPNKPITVDAQAMIDGANANPGYIPGPGEVIAVICDPPHTCGDLCDERCFQYIFIEVPVPGLYEGKTPGFWKTHPDDWPEDYDPVTTTLKDAGFVIPGGNMDDNRRREVDEDDTLMMALRYKGGWGRSGAAQILLRAAAAALLNAAHEKVNYKFDKDTILGMVNDALGSGNRFEMISLAITLDYFNNFGCDDL
jgi:hypothetical protein